MKTIPCKNCGRTLRPCNMRRHVRARHMPKVESTDWGSLVTMPENPIKAGRGKDRRYDEHVPRGEGPHRYRIYRLRAGDLQLVATAPTEEAMGRGLAQLHAEREFIGDDSVGVLDTKSEPGHWVINPFTLGRRPPDGE